MSDAANRPVTSGEAVTSLPKGEAPAWQAPLPPGADEVPYRPLSVPAILGLGLAVIYACLVIVGGLLAFNSKFPGAFRALVLLAPLLGVLGAALAREHPDFLVHPPRRRAARRAQHDQVAGLGERGLDPGGEVDGARQLFTVAKDRKDAGRHARGHERLGNAIRLERTMQPFPPPLVAVAVADERPVPRLRRRVHHAGSLS